MTFATANEMDLTHNVGYCVACLGEIEVHGVRRWIDDAGGRTALCPHCGIDAVVPLNHMPSNPRQREQLLRQWREQGFGDMALELGLPQHQWIPSMQAPPQQARAPKCSH